ncbi:aminoacyl-tRNA hydrolase [Candidatus Beckwithbacteria bacterium CG10_big_fil_rev_8_21_14_0_10_34_10]|uniref:Peptidyl-tRNA hydrolase n=1 Tax=Candidatus Beckwithbacteria bacterium CG10_big_fil_rev_8_21_14_0_10_34_10 TaxID=1974495 RepID=A0A2H0W7X6_9BACT|nr:MAG: aminoacyl-tRNA hydrolase [Candidatus Beckwithbacteria bacterium CG10_big_fil_rev_8_21_14_0_10_34_10]
MKQIKLIVGLGNPGKKYQLSRHNLGFSLIDKIIKDRKLTESKKFNSLIAKTKQCVLLKPQTFMNKSGLAIAKAKQFYKLKPENILIVHDDLDIPLGKYKLQFGKGPKLHKGIHSIERQLKTNKFWRLRLGIEDRKAEDDNINGEDYVLNNFSKKEMKIITKVFTRAAINLFKEEES